MHNKQRGRLTWTSIVSFRRLLILLMQIGSGMKIFLFSFLPPDLSETVKLIPIPQEHWQDQLCWGSNRLQRIKLSDMRHYIYHSQHVFISSYFRNVWKLGLSILVKTF